MNTLASVEANYRIYVKAYQIDALFDRIKRQFVANSPQIIKLKDGKG